MEMPEGWKRLSAKQYSVLIPVEKSLAKEVVYSLDLMREMSEALDQYSDQAGRDSLADVEGSRFSIASEVLHKFRNWK